MKKMAVFSIALVAASWAQAWPKEPESVLGVVLGQQLSEQSLPRCPANVLDATSPCLEVVETGPRPTDFRRFAIGGAPFRYVGFEIVVDEAKVVTEVRAHLPQSRYAEFLMALEERYGKPTSLSAGKVQSRLGAEFSNSIAVWQGQRMTITATERHEQIDRALVSFSDNEAARRRNESLRSTVKDAASKL